MAEFREGLQLLITLQEKDSELDGLRKRAETIPQEIENKRQLILTTRSDFENMKKEAVQNQLKRKEKELDLGGKEEEIKKFNRELNSIKTNEAYKALLSQIDKTKQEKEVLENEILDIMEKAEELAKESNTRETECKKSEADINAQVASMEADLVKLNEEIARLAAGRAEFAAQIPGDILKNYEYIRESRGGVAIVTIIGDDCGGCHMTLRPQLVNDAQKCKSFVFCDSCSRILYKK